MKVLAAAGEGEGLWLRADSQTGGRGRQGRAWQSHSGNLHASTLVRLRPGDPAAASLALVAAVALHETVAPFLAAAAQPPMLKWPNDLLLGGAKLAGILLEREGDAVAIGFGVNLAAAPEGLDRPATCVAEHAMAPPPDIFIRGLAEGFAARLAQWRAAGLEPTRLAWLERAHPTGTPLVVRDTGGEPLQGGFDGLTESGALRLRLADGACRVIQAGDVFLV